MHLADSAPPELSASRRELSKLLLTSDDRQMPLAALPPDAVRPLSLAQERIWLSTRLAGGPSGTYTTLTRLSGPLDVTRLQSAFATVFRRHDILRTTFAGEVQPRIVVHEDAKFELPLVDLSGLPAADQQAEVRRIVQAESQRTRDLASWPLLRLLLLRLNETDHRLVGSVHHIISDGWSTGVLCAEVARYYAEGGQAAAEPRPALQYHDFAAWQREWSATPEMQAHIAWWKQQLSGQIPPLELPIDHPRTAGRELRGGTYAFELPEPLARSLVALGRSAGATPFATLLAAFGTLLHRVTGRDEIPVGSPVANRNRRELESILGCFMQPIVLRCNLAGDPTFLDLLGRIRELCHACYAHQDAPFELVMRAVRPQWDRLHAPLFQVLFNVQRAEVQRFELPGLQSEPFELHSPTSGLDLAVHLWVGERQINGVVEYAAELFDESTIAWLMRCYRSLLESIAADPQQRLSELEISGRDDTSVADVNLPANLPPQRRKLLRLLLGSVDDVGPASITALPRDGRPLPCSFGQERLWFVDQIQPAGAIYNQSQALELAGPLDVAALQQALNEIVSRHEILRTAIVTENGRPMQHVAEQASVPLTVADFSGLPPPEQSRRAEQHLAEHARQEFDLARPPLGRATLVRFGAERHLLSATVHHLIGDGWSMRVFRKELAALYAAFAAGRPSPLPPLAVQYADFAHAQRRWTREAMLAGQLAWWKRQLGGELPQLELPADLPRPTGATYCRKVSHRFALGGDVPQRLQALGREEGVTPFMTLLAAYFVLLLRYTGQTDLIVDTPITGRRNKQLEELLGFFVNSLALRADLSGQPSFRQLLARVRQTCLDSFARQDLPFDNIVSHLTLDRNRLGQPLTPVSFMLHEALAREEELGAGVHMRPAPYDISDEFDASLIVWRDTDEWSGDLQYDPQLFTPEAIGRMAAHFQTLVTAALAEPDRPIAELPLLPAAEERLLCRDWSRDGDAVADGCSIHQLFERQVRLTPDSVAVISPGSIPGDTDDQLTYDQLNRARNQLARHLHSLGLGAEDRVGICLNRSCELIAAVWGVLKAGAAFVPLDVAQPVQRLEEMLRASRVSLVVSQSGLLPPALTASTRMLLLDEAEDRLAAQDDANLELPVDIHQLAYVVFTSGSTGLPKGVMVAHRNLVTAYRAWEESYRLRETRAHLQMASFSFDVFVGDLVRAHCSGARLVLCPRESLLAPVELGRLLETYEIDCAEFVPAVMRVLVEHLQQAGRRLDRLRLAVVGSDTWSAADYEQLKRLTGPLARVINSYGVAEATIDSSYFEQSGADQAALRDPLPIGRPFAGCELVILDRQLQLAPIGVAGELYLGGAGVTRGYVDGPGQTAERFVPHPFSDRPGARLYRTGDRARWRADGNLELLGRLDEQIKIRGFRVEPGEIESRLREHSEVRRAVVVLRESAREKQLVAYVVADRSPGELAGVLRGYLRERLPEYMVPAAIVVLDQLPLSPNGKVDRRALPAPPTSRHASPTLGLPQSTAECRVAALWSQILGVPEVGLSDNFFDLGGHSLLLFELQSSLRTEFGQTIPLVELFRLPTVQDQAGRLAAAAAPASPQRSDAVRERSQKLRQSLARQQAARSRRNGR